MTDYPVSETVKRIADLAKKRGEISINDCIELLGDRSILLVLLLFGLINSLPMPGIPGVSTITGIPILFLSFQIMRGSKTIWMPKKFRERSLHSPKLFAGMEKAIPTLKKIEKRLKPRLLPLSHAPFRNFIGVLIFILAFMLSLPIPFANLPMGFSISVLTIGLLERDGFVILAGLILALISLILLPVLFMDGLKMLFS